MQLAHALRLASVALFASIVAIGCKPKIGDKCASSTDCSTSGDRLCDTTQPGGYCTMFNCEPDGCPAGEAACVGFYATVCGDPQRTPRFGRTFCMATCSGDGDCRAGYACVDMGSQVVDVSPSSRSVCVVPPGVEPPIDADAGVCSVTDAGLPDAPASSPDAGAVDAADAADEAAVDAADDGSADAAGDADLDAGDDALGDATLDADDAG